MLEAHHGSWTFQTKDTAIFPPSCISFCLLHLVRFVTSTLCFQCWMQHSLHWPCPLCCAPRFCQAHDGLLLFPVSIASTCFMHSFGWKVMFWGLLFNQPYMPPAVKQEGLCPAPDAATWNGHAAEIKVSKCLCIPPCLCACRFWFRWSVVCRSERLGVAAPVFRPPMLVWDEWLQSHTHSQSLQARAPQLHTSFRMRHCFQFWHFFADRNVVGGDRVTW
jgi:hypothetical protein